ncbi:MAG: sulfite exporter TauE/SafE family protein [Actinobacteria bacterium]|nr:sulfite exporter TauE/SafE family protein [Actinomycetota bacterium]
MPDVLWIAVIVFGGTIIRTTFGFGDALFAMPMMSLVIGVTTATPVMGLISLLVAAGALVTSWRHIEVTAVRRLLAASLIGIPVGVFALKNVDEHLLRSALGVLIASFGLFRLVTPRMPELHDRRWAFPFGFVSGCLGGAYNIGGPPIVMYGAMRRWPTKRFRATLHGGFLPTTLLVAVAHGLGGLWTTEVLELVAYSVPGVVAAMFLGEALARRLDSPAFERYLSVVLVVLGVLLVI